MFDISEQVNQGVQHTFADITNSVITDILAPAVEVINQASYMLDKAGVVNGVRYAQILALSLLAIKVIVDGIHQYMLHESGDSKADPTGLLIRTATSVLAIAFTFELVKIVFDFGSKVFIDVSAIQTVDGNIDNDVLASLPTSFLGQLQLTLSDPVAFGAANWTINISAIAFVVMFIAIIFQCLIRGAEVALMAIVGPIFALNLASNDKQLWEQWFRQVIVLCLAQAVQIFVFRLGITESANTMISAVNGEFEFNNILAMLAWFWVAIKVPKILKEFTYSTGGGAMVGGMVQSISSSVVQNAVGKVFKR